MRSGILVGLILVSAAAVQAADKIQPLNIKLGLWESSMTTTTSSAGKSRTTTSKGCITKEKLEKSPAFSDLQKECTMTVVTSTSSKADVRVVCQGAGMKGNGTLQIEALSPVSVRGSGHSTLTVSGQTVNISSTFTSKWIGPACGDTK